MRITIQERQRPYSFRPGARLLLPGTRKVVTAYPTRLEIDGQVQELERPMRQPWFVEQDLERPAVRLWPQNHLIEGERGATERLSLSSHRKQEWEYCLHRRDLQTLLPLWFRLGQLTPGERALPKGASLLTRLDFTRPETLASSLEAILLAGFDGLLVPRGEDRDHHGYALPPVPQGEDPFLLLTAGSDLLRSLFVQTSDETLTLLPHLPPQFHCGRMTEVETPWGVLAFEWTKKSLRRVILRAKSSTSLTLKLPAGVKRYRLRHHRRQELQLDVPMPIEVSQGEIYFFDQFQR